MASFVLTDALVGYTTGASTGAHNNLSTYVRSVAVAAEAETQDDTAMGDDWRSFVGGLKNWAFDIEFNQDFEATDIGPGGADFWNLMGTTGLHWRVRPTTAAASSTNPEFRGYGMLININPVDGSVGDLAIENVQIQGFGTLTRGTTSNTG